MEYKEILLSKTKFKSYIKVLIDFDNLITDYYKKIKEKKTTLIKDFGYLIIKKDFDKLNEELSFSKFKKYINDDSKFNEKLNEKYGKNNHITFIPFEQKIFNTSKELIVNLSKSYEYIIINTEVWKKFNNGKYKENEGKIAYEINENHMNINLYGDKVYFKHNLNIIKYNDLLSRKRHEELKTFKENNDEKKDKLLIKDYINAMINYYVFNTNMINDIESTKQTDSKEKIKLLQNLKILFN